MQTTPIPCSLGAKQGDENSVVLKSSSEEAKSFKGGKEAKRARRLEWITEADAEHLLSFKQSNCNVGFQIHILD